MRRYRRLLRVFGRTAREREREIDEEIQAHIAMRTEDLVASGVPPREAERLARERFGNVDRARRDGVASAARRDARLAWGEAWAGVRRDVVVGLRRAARAPGHAATSVAVFALGIGLTTVMFTVVDHVLLRPLPFPETDELVALWSVQESGEPFGQVSMGNWYDWRGRNATLAATGLHAFPRPVTVATERDVFTVSGVYVSGAYFETLRPRMLLGRALGEAEIQEDAAVAVVSEGFWTRVLGRDPLGPASSLTLDGRAVRVVGVVAAGYEHPEGVDVWLGRPYRSFVGAARNNINYVAVARLVSGTSPEAAQADLSAIADAIRAEDPEGLYSWGVSVRPLQDVVVSGARRYLLLLLGAVGFVLLVGCTNLAALGLARASERVQEMGVRLSLGAGRGRLVRQIVTEQLLLAAAGGFAGLLLSAWGTEALMRRVGSVVPRAHEVGFDLRVACFATALSALAGLLAGLVPALRASGVSPAASLSGTRMVGPRTLAGRVLVGVEVALTVLLLTGGGLLGLSLGAVSRRELGFEAEGVVTARVSLGVSPSYRDPGQVVGYWERLSEALAAVPGVESVGIGNWVPTDEGGSSFIELDGDPRPGAGAGYRVVGGDYFRALGIPLLAGRAFTDQDRAEGPRVAVVNRAMAERFWPAGNVLGRRLRAPSMESWWYGGEAPWLTVVGVVGDIRHWGFESEPRPEMFVLYRQIPGMAATMTAVVRVGAALPSGALPSVRARARSVDPSLAIDVAALSDRVRRTLAERRLVATLLASFAAVALLLASLGVYGVVSHAVAGRTREMAVRAALGAPRTGLVRMVVGAALRVVAVGAGVGLALAFGLRRVLDGLLLDVASGHPLPYAAAVVVLLGAGFVAALLPARRATRLEPTEALRGS